MTPERRQEIARQGGRAAHEKGTAHRWTHEDAVEAGRKGGLAVGLIRQTARDKDRRIQDGIDNVQAETKS
jgi:hypothetical protein